MWAVQGPTRLTPLDQKTVQFALFLLLNAETELLVEETLIGLVGAARSKLTACGMPCFLTDSIGFGAVEG